MMPVAIRTLDNEIFRLGKNSSRPEQRMPGPADVRTVGQRCFLIALCDPQVDGCRTQQMTRPRIKGSHTWKWMKPLVKLYHLYLFHRLFYVLDTIQRDMQRIPL